MKEKIEGMMKAQIDKKKRKENQNLKRGERKEKENCECHERKRNRMKEVKIMKEKLKEGRLVTIYVKTKRNFL